MIKLPSTLFFLKSSYNFTYLIILYIKNNIYKLCLVKFNEELKSDVYKRAAERLNRLGHKRRSSEIEDWSKKVELKEKNKLWKDLVDKFSKYGKVKAKIKNEKDDSEIETSFYIYLHLDYDPLYSNNHELPDDITEITIFISLIPTDEEDYDLLMRTYNKFIFTGMYFQFKYEIQDDGSHNLYESYDFGYNNGDYSVYLVDRPSAGRLKLLLTKIFDEESDYPGSTMIDGQSVTRYKTLYSEVNSEIYMNKGFSSDTGASIYDILDYFKRISPNKLYRS